MTSTKPDGYLYLTPLQLSNLKSYKYSGVDLSYLSRYILNPFWCRLVTLFPLWMAPNLITLTGLLFMISATALVLLTTPTRYTYLYVSFCISTYLNMDAIDGKQARRTGTSGPLGELFDHGCDAINMMLMAVLIPFVYNIPSSSAVTLLMALFGYITFYASTWEEYHTDTLFLDYISGPVEGAWGVVLSALLSAIFGPELWSRPISIVLSLNTIIPLIFIFGSISSIITSTRHAKQRSAILPGFFLPVVYFSACVLLILAIPSNLYTWFIFATGFPACFRISSTIIAYVTKSTLRTASFYPIEYVPIMLLVSKLFLPTDVWISAFKASVFSSAGIYMYTMLLVIADITKYLNINCLTIKPKQ